MRNSTVENRSFVETECNLTISNEIDDSRDEYLAYWEIATLALIFVVAIAGNSLVVAALYFRRYDTPRKKFARMYFFILHLSIADLLTALLNVFPQLVWEITFRFQGGPILCKFVKFGQTLGPYLSSYVLAATALDRYQAVRHPLIYCSTSTRSKIMVYLAWSLALLLCVPQILVFSYKELSPGVWDCWATFDVMPYGQRTYVTWYSISVFILPLIILVYTYTSICVVIWTSNGIVGEAQDTHGAGLLRQRTVISRAKINSVKQMIAVISLYAASSSPFIASLLWVTWDPNASASPFFSGAAFTILTLLSSLNSCVNPWIYLALNRDLSGALINRVYPTRGSSSMKSQENRQRSIGIARTTSSASSSGTSVRSYASRMSRYANSIMRRPSDTSNKELQPSYRIR